VRSAVAHTLAWWTVIWVAACASVLIVAWSPSEGPSAQLWNGILELSGLTSPAVAAFAVVFCASLLWLAGATVGVLLSGLWRAVGARSR